MKLEESRSPLVVDPAASGGTAAAGATTPAPDAGAPSGRSRAGAAGRFVRTHRSESSLIVVLAVVAIFATTQSDVFLTWQNWRTLLVQGSFVGILACGMTVLMVAGGIDLSVGAAVSFSGMVLGMSAVEWGLPIGVAIVLTLVVATVVGLGNGLLAANSVAHPFILTLGTMTLLSGCALIVDTDPIIDISPGLVDAMASRVAGVPLVVVVFAVAALVCHLLLSQTIVGRHLFAVGGSKDAARLAGVRVPRLTLGMYAFMGLLVGITAILMTGTFSSAGPSAGQGMELTAIAAVAVGGTPLQGGRGGIFGTVLGLLLIVMIGNVLNLLAIDPNLQYVLVGAIIVIAVMVQGRRPAA